MKLYNNTDGAIRIVLFNGETIAIDPEDNSGDITVTAEDLRELQLSFPNGEIKYEFTDAEKVEFPEAYREIAPDMDLKPSTETEDDWDIIGGGSKGVINVDPVNGKNASAGRNGVGAYKDIWEAIAIAEIGDTIYVYPGTIDLTLAPESSDKVLIKHGVNIIFVGVGTINTDDIAFTVTEDTACRIKATDWDIIGSGKLADFSGGYAVDIYMDWSLMKNTAGDTIMDFNMSGLSDNDFQFQIGKVDTFSDGVQILANSNVNLYVTEWDVSGTAVYVGAGVTAYTGTSDLSWESITIADATGTIDLFNINIGGAGHVGLLGMVDNTGAGANAALIKAQLTHADANLYVGWEMTYASVAQVANVLGSAGTIWFRGKYVADYQDSRGAFHFGGSIKAVLSAGYYEADSDYSVITVDESATLTARGATIKANGNTSVDATGIYMAAAGVNVSIRDVFFEVKSGGSSITEAAPTAVNSLGSWVSNYANSVSTVKGVAEVVQVDLKADIFCNSDHIPELAGYTGHRGPGKKDRDRERQKAFKGVKPVKI